MLSLLVHALASPAEPAAVTRAVLADPPRLAALQNAAFPGSLPADDAIRLGSVFSGLVHRAEDGADVFWGLTDRGPNDEAKKDGAKVRLIHLPGYDPAILKL